MRLLHLSDLHIAANDNLNEPLKKRFEFIKQHYPDHNVIITGDIIDNEGAVRPGVKVPVDLDWNLAQTALIYPPPPIGNVQPHITYTRRALQNAYNIISSFPADRIYICPGNHDYGLWGNIYDKLFADAFENILWKPINQRHWPISFGPSIQPVVTSLLPKQPLQYLLSSSGISIRLIALNTCPDASSVVSPMNLATGIVGGGQLNALQQGFLPQTLFPGIGPTLFPNLVTILFLHHHPWAHTDWTLKLQDSNNLMSIIRNNVDLILFGHKHIERRYPPNEQKTIGIKYGGLAAGSSRFETQAWEITINPSTSVSLSKVRII
jgi:hypothetical protein